MLTLDTTEMQKQLDEYKRQLTLALEGAVKEFSIEIVRNLIPATPYGDSTQFADYYLSRPWMYPQEEGMTRANWDVSLRSYTPSVDYVSGTRQGENSLEDTTRHISSYKLGDKVYIFNATPYIEEIRGNQTDGDLEAKFERVVQATYQAGAKFKDFVDK